MGFSNFDSSFIVEHDLLRQERCAAESFFEHFGVDNYSMIRGFSSSEFGGGTLANNGCWENADVFYDIKPVSFSFLSEYKISSIKFSSLCVTDLEYKINYYQRPSIYDFNKNIRNIGILCITVHPYLEKIDWDNLPYDQCKNKSNFLSDFELENRSAPVSTELLEFQHAGCSLGITSMNKVKYATEYDVDVFLSGLSNQNIPEKLKIDLCLEIKNSMLLLRRGFSLSFFSRNNIIS